MKSKLYAILKTLMTFFLCFSLLSIHVEITPEHQVSVEYSSVEASDGGGGMMSMVMMLTIGLVAFRLLNMCAKTAPDILIAAAAGAIYVAGEAMAIMGHSDDSEGGAEGYDGSEGNEAAQTEAFQAQKKQKEDTKKAAETKLTLQTAAAVAFGVAAATAFASSMLLKAEAATCLLATTDSAALDGAAILGSTDLLKVSTKADALLDSSMMAIDGAITACTSSLSTCQATCTSYQSTMAATCNNPLTAAACAAATTGAGIFCPTPPLLGASGSMLGNALATETQAKAENNGVMLQAPEAISAETTAETAASAAAVSIVAVQEALVATLPSKMIAETIWVERELYGKSLMANSKALILAEEILADSYVFNDKSMVSCAETTVELEAALAKAAGASACPATAACEGAISGAVTANAAAVEGLAEVNVIHKAAMSQNAQAVIGAEAATAACTILSATLETQIAMCAPETNAGAFMFINSESPRMCSNKNEEDINSIDKVLAGIFNPKAKLDYNDIDQAALAKARKDADDPMELFQTFVNKTLDLFVNKADAGFMDILGLAGPIVGIVAGLTYKTSFEWDNLLASPGNRAMIWTGLGVITAAAAMQTSSQISELEEDISSLEGIAEKLEGLDKDAQSKEELKNAGSKTSLAGKRTKVDDINFASSANGKSVNSRLKDIEAEPKSGSQFSSGSTACLKKDKNGACIKFGSLLNSGNLGLDKTTANIGKLSDSLATSTTLGDSKSLAAKIGQEQGAVNKVLRKQIKRLNAIRSKNGQKPIDFHKKGADLLKGLEGKVGSALKKKGFSGSNISSAFDHKAARQKMLANMKKSKRSKRPKTASYKYKAKKIKMAKRRKGGFGLDDFGEATKVSNKDGLELKADRGNSSQSRRRSFDPAISDIAEDTGQSIFGQISKRFHRLKQQRRFR